MAGNGYLLDELEKWKKEGLIDATTYDTLHARYYEESLREEQLHRSTFKLEVLSGGGIAILIIAIILLMTFLDLGAIWFGHIFMSISLASLLMTLLLWRFTKLKYLALGMFCLYFILMDLSLVLYWTTMIDDRGSAMVRLFAFPIMLFPFIGLVASFFKRSRAILVVSWAVLYSAIFFGLVTVLGEKVEIWGLFMTLLCGGLLVTALVVRKLMRIPSELSWHPRLTYLLMAALIIPALFAMDSHFDWVWEKAILLLLLSAPLLVMGLLWDDRPLSIVALLVLIGDAFFFGVSQGKIIGAGIALFITAALLIGFSIFLGLKARYNQRAEMTDPGEKGK